MPTPVLGAKAGQSTLSESPTEATGKRGEPPPWGKAKDCYQKKEGVLGRQKQAKPSGKIEVNQNRVRGTNGRLPAFQSIQSHNSLYRTVGRRAEAHFLEGLSQVPVMENSRLPRPHH